MVFVLSHLGCLMVVLRVCPGGNGNQRLKVIVVALVEVESRQLCISGTGAKNKQTKGEKQIQE